MSDQKASPAVFRLQKLVLDRLLEFETLDDIIEGKVIEKIWGRLTEICKVEEETLKRIVEKMDRL